jgi:hypothetical protein
MCGSETPVAALAADFAAAPAPAALAAAYLAVVVVGVSMIAL